MSAGAGEELERALGLALAGHGGALDFTGRTSRPWASVAFSGARHRLVLCIGGPDAQSAADAFLDGLADREFALRGHVLADIAVIGDVRDGNCVHLTLEALTVEES